MKVRIRDTNGKGMEDPGKERVKSRTVGGESMIGEKER